MPFTFPAHTQRQRQRSAAAILWTLKLDGDIEDGVSAIAVLEKRLAKRGESCKNRQRLSALVSDLETPEWGELVLRKLHGRHTQGVYLVEDDPDKLPPNPFPEAESEPEPAPVVAEPVAVAATPANGWATPPPPEFDSFVRNVTTPRPDPIDQLRAAAAKAKTNGAAEPVVDLTGDEEFDVVRALDETDQIITEDFEPFDVPSELVDQSTVLDKLCVAQGLLNSAAIQAAQQQSVTTDKVIAERLHHALEQNQTLRRQRDEARETAYAHKKTITGLQANLRQVQANYQNLVKAAQAERRSDGMSELDRLVRAAPTNKG